MMNSIVQLYYKACNKTPNIEVRWLDPLDLAGLLMRALH
jgi:hypothetical protein